jgi:hypothetical protein
MQGNNRDDRFRSTATVEVTARHKVDEVDEAEDLQDQEATLVSDTSRGKRVVETLPPGVRAQLTFLEGPGKGDVVNLEKGHNTLGRQKDCDVIINCPLASGKHAAIFFLDSLEWRIEDLGSKNGTLLNGSRVKGFALRSGDKILVGDALMLFSVERA